MKYDVIVIGTGPGGEGAAMQAAKGGKRVAVVERSPQVGGGCTHWGTIPSKALRHAIFSVTEALANQLLASCGTVVKPSVAELSRNARSIIEKQVAMRQGFYDRNDVPVIQGQACFVDPHTIEVKEERYQADHFVIATGSRPYRPPFVDFEHPRIFDSDKILSLDQHPKSMTVYGAGVVGCEYASMFRNLGIKVNLINTRAKLLEFLDDEIIDALGYHFRDQGMVIRHNEQCARIDGGEDGVVLTLESGKCVKSDILLWANGRQGNSENLGLETIDLECNSRGQLDVNDDFQTTLSHVYAVGDIIGFPSLASAAYSQGRKAACHLLGEVIAQREQEAHDIPTGIYTSPEISSVGKTERELTEAKVPYEVGHSQFKSLARAQITGRTVGMLKLLFHRQTLEILGIHCFGANASEIIHIGQAIMQQQAEANTLKYFMNTTFNYPTMAEAYRVAALNGYNRLF
ncbi:MAG: Si-specific NAD(P)(+) transhydrogenase [Blastopirellula sp.]|nr:Si-specific NAD(P)(+) transhydrogenase [Blastopirellula sp.]